MSQADFSIQRHLRFFFFIFLKKKFIFFKKLKPSVAAFKCRLRYNLI